MSADCPHCCGLKENQCVDCAVDTWEIAEYYMVTDDVWRWYGAGPGMLCIGCLERRMGRSLTAADFTMAPINTDIDFRRSQLLQERLVA